MIETVAETLERWKRENEQRDRDWAILWRKWSGDMKRILDNRKRSTDA